MNLGGLLEKTYRTLHDEIVDGIVTTGGTLTITDTQLISKYFDGKFKNWECFIGDTGEYARISGNVNSTGVITLAATVGSVTAGDPYAVVKTTVPFNTMVRLVPDAFAQIGPVWMPPDTSGTTAVSTRNYSLPIALKGVDIREIYLRDSNNYRYDAPAYSVLHATAGTALDTLQFHAQPVTGKTIVIEYVAPHPALSVYSSTIVETVPEKLIVSSLVERALFWKKNPKNRKVDVQNWQEASVLFQDALAKYRVPRPQKESRRVPITWYN